MKGLLASRLASPLRPAALTATSTATPTPRISQMSYGTSLTRIRGAGVSEPALQKVTFTGVNP